MVPGESRNTRQSSVTSPASCGHGGDSNGGDGSSDAVVVVASGGAGAQGKREGCGGSQRAGRGLRGARGCQSREYRRRGSGGVRRRGWMIPAAWRFPDLICSSGTTWKTQAMSWTSPSGAGWLLDTVTTKIRRQLLSGVDQERQAAREGRGGR